MTPITYEAMETLTTLMANASRLERTLLSSAVTDERTKGRRAAARTLIKRRRKDLRQLEGAV